MPKLDYLLPDEFNEPGKHRKIHQRQNKRRKLIASTRSGRNHRSRGSFKNGMTAHWRGSKSYPIHRCDDKFHFEHKRDATRSADSYMDRIGITIDPMVPYYCRHHSKWHIGHDTRFPKARRAEYQAKCVERERIRKGARDPKRPPKRYQ